MDRQVGDRQTLKDGSNPAHIQLRSFEAHDFLLAVENGGQQVEETGVLFVQLLRSAEKTNSIFVIQVQGSTYVGKKALDDGLIESFKLAEGMQELDCDGRRNIIQLFLCNSPALPFLFLA